MGKRKSRTGSAEFKRKVATGSSIARRADAHPVTLADTSGIIAVLDRWKARLDERLDARKREARR